MAQSRQIKYVERDFNDFRNQLIEYAKNYFPDTYNDFTETSPGMMFIEMASYVGDILSFYQDSQIQETYLQYAKDPANLYSLAYMMGYRPKVTTVSEATIEITQQVDPVEGDANYSPNFNQALSVVSPAVIASGDTQFIIEQKIDFGFSSSYDPTEVTVLSVDSNGNPERYQLKKTAKAFSGNIKQITRTFGVAEKFTTITIEDENIIGILDIIDEDGDKWYEVPFLGQDTIFAQQNNASPADADQVQFSSQLLKVPRRFVTRFTSQGVLQIQFGSGISGDDDIAFLPDPTNVGSGTNQGITRLDYAYDPSNFLYSSAYGLAPSFTTLTIRYLVGGGVEANVPANTITTKITANATATDETFANSNSVEATLAFTNPKAAIGGRDGDTVEEVRQNSFRSFNEQGRVVTLQDYTIRALSLPPRFGALAKVFVAKDQTLAQQGSGLLEEAIDNPLALSMFVLAYDSNGRLTTAPLTLKQNLRKYMSQYMMLTDGLTIRNAFVVNIGVKFEVLALPNYNARDVLFNCNQAMIEYFNVKNWAINQPINISAIYTALDRVKGVQTVQKITIENKQGANYTGFAYDIDAATRNNIIYPAADPMIFEVRYPQQDIQGRITTV